MKKVIFISGASSEFGRLSAEALALAGHSVLASMGDAEECRPWVAAELAKLAASECFLRIVEMEMENAESITKVVSEIIDECGNIEVLTVLASHSNGETS